MATDLSESQGQSAANQGQERVPPLKRPGVRRGLLAAGVLVLVAGGIWLAQYQMYGKFEQDTNDAYIQADAVTISPKISGYVEQVLVGDNQDVKVGQPLVRIDPRDYDAQAQQYQAQIDVAKANADNVRATIGEQEAAIAQLAAAHVNVGSTVLKSSVAGRIGDRTVRAGQFVQAGTRLMSVVPLSKLYVTANFKETQIGLMRPGQPATIEIDALDGTKIAGHVESISPGTGAQFSLLPPQNATGNFTKIVQRVPVRIAIDAGTEARRVLVPGLSVVVTVDTISAKGAQHSIAAQEEARRDAKQ